MSNLAVTNVRLVSSTGSITNSDGSTTFLSFDNSTGYVETSRLVVTNGVSFPTGGLQSKAVNSVSDLLATNPSTGDSLVWDGSTWVPGSSFGRLLSINTYTNQDGIWSNVSSAGGSGTWTKPTGCSRVLVYVTGGGGGARVNDSTYRNAGGGGGGTSIRYIDVSSVNSVAVTWGAGGGYARNGGRGGTGGTSTFGAYCSAFGGQGGFTDSPYEGGRGGDATGGDINLVGGSGEMSHGSDREGGGGMSFWHKAGSHHHNADNGAQNAHGRWGSGGGYGYYSQNGFAHNNSVGGGGCVIVFNYS